MTTPGALIQDFTLLPDPEALHGLNVTMTAGFVSLLVDVASSPTLSDARQRCFADGGSSSGCNDISKLTLAHGAGKGSFEPAVPRAALRLNARYAQKNARSAAPPVLNASVTGLRAFP